MLGLFITLVIIGGAVSTKPRCGMCPTIKPEYIDTSRMVGGWDEWKRSNNTRDNTASCGRMYFSKPDANGDVQLTFSSISSLVRGNSSLAAIARFNNNKVSVDLHLPVLGIFQNMIYYIIETDYDNYYIVWSCQQLKKGYIPTIYVKVRSPASACGIDTIIANALKKRGLPAVELIKESRPNCPSCY